MKCLVLAAGYATRLYPLTKDTPKPLLEISGKPLLEHILLKVEEIKDIDEIYIVTNDKFYQNFLEWNNNFKSNIKIKIINDNTKSNDDRLGAIGDINFTIKNESINDDLLIVAGDNLFEFNLTNLHDFFKSKNSSVVALYDIINKDIAANKLGVVSLDHNNTIIELQEKPAQPKTSIISTACYIIHKNHIELFEKCLEDKNKPDNIGEFISWISSKQKVYGKIFSEAWFDIGSLDQLEKARLKFK